MGVNHLDTYAHILLWRCFSVRNRITTHR